MILKLIKYLAALIVAVIVFWCMTHNNNSTTARNSKNLTAAQTQSANKVTCARYTAKVGKWSLSADFEKCAMRSNNEFVFTNISGILTKKIKKVEIRAKQCNVIWRGKKAHLEGGVTIVSDGLDIITQAAIVDWGRMEIAGNSGVAGEKNGMKFAAQGFLLKKNGEIVLKQARFDIAHGTTKAPPTRGFARL